VGIVSERIDPTTGKGRVLVEGEDWRAASLMDAALEPGTRVMVVRVEGRLCTWTRRPRHGQHRALIVPRDRAGRDLDRPRRASAWVQQAQTMIIERLGKYHRTLASGVNLIIPIIDKPRAIDWHQVIVTPAGDSFARHFRTEKIDLRETVYVFPRQNVITKDNVVVGDRRADLLPDHRPGARTYEIANLPDAIEKLTQTTLRNVIGEMELDHVLSSRDTINAKLREILRRGDPQVGREGQPGGAQGHHPPRDIRDAMEKQMRAERDRRAAILTAEAEKQSRTLQSEGIRQSEINQAEGQKQAGSSQRGGGQRPPQGRGGGSSGDRADHDGHQGNRRGSGTVLDRHPLHRGAQGHGHEPAEQQGHLSPVRGDRCAGVLGAFGDAGGSTRREENMKKEKALLVGVVTLLLSAVRLTASPPRCRHAIPTTAASRCPRASARSWSRTRWARRGTSRSGRTAICSSRCRVAQAVCSPCETPRGR